MGADGKPRQLHIEKAVEVTKLTPPEYPTKAMGEIEQKDGCSVQLLSKCDYFRVNKVCVWEHCVFEASAKSFNSLLVLDGEGEIDGVKLKKGDSFFIPAGYGEYTFKGKAEMVITDID